MSTSTIITSGVVPWLIPSRFKKVYENLFATELEKKKWAINEIAVWETRCYPYLPSAIEATFLLFRAVVQDIMWDNNLNSFEHSDLQAIYGSAITRFVSLSIDTNRKNDSFRHYSSVQIAKLFGIPSFIVDIRNEWCHSKKPTLSILRSATESALGYLKSSYWDKEVARLNSLVKPVTEEQLFGLFKQFIAYFMQVIKGSKSKIHWYEDGTGEVDKDYRVLLKTLEKCLKNNMKLFVKVLAFNGIFIPTDEDLKCMLSDEEVKYFNAEPFFENDTSENEEEKMDTDDAANFLEHEQKNFPELPKYHEKLWEPIIRLLNKYDALPMFMEKLLISQGDRTVAGQKLLISWVRKILHLHCVHYSERSRRFKKIFRNKGLALNWKCLFYASVANPCRYTSIFLPLILANLPVNKDPAIQLVVNLMSIKLGFAKDQANKFFKFYHTSEDLETAVGYHRRKVDEEKSHHNIWSSFPDNCHKSWVIGSVVNQDKIDEEEEEIFESIFKPLPVLKSEFNKSNKNEEEEEEEEEEDDDQTSQGTQLPDLNKILLEIQKKDTVMLKRSD